MGFDYFYGFIDGETHQYYPVIFENTTPVEPKKDPEQGYHFMADMTDRAIEWMKYTKSVAPQKPLLLYFAPGAAHAPHHAPNITPVILPPYSPELNPAENVWEYLRKNKLAYRFYETYEDIVQACCDAWNSLMAMPDRIASIAARTWAKVS